MMIALTCVCIVLIVTCVILTMEMTNAFKYISEHDNDILALSEAIQKETEERKREASYMHSRMDGVARMTSEIRRDYVLYREPVKNGGVQLANEYEVNEDE